MTPVSLDVPTRRQAHGWLAVWALLAAVVALLWWVGFRPNADLDDVMKLHEIRHLLASGSLFDRTVPGVLQPEPMVSHWPWIVDAPYAAVALLLGGVMAPQTALHVATLVVPPLLMMPAVWLLSRIVIALGFTRPLRALAVAALVALLSATEFQSERIDYHNLQMIALLGIVLLTMGRGARAAGLCGATVALSMALSAELAGFLALALAIFAGRYVLAREGSGGELRALGAGLAAGATVLYVLLTPAASYGAGLCDRYSAVHLVALAGAGAVFGAAPSLAGRHALARAGVLTAGAALALALVIALYPQCLAGPYGNLDLYVKQNWLAPIAQDGTILAYPRFARSVLFALIAPGIVAIGAAAVATLAARPADRAWAVYAIFALGAVAQAMLALRLMRVVPLLAGPSAAFLLSVLSPTLADSLGSRLKAKVGPGSMLAPGAALVAMLFALPALTSGRQVPVNGVMVAESCSGPFPALEWPRGARILAPTSISMELLDPEAGVSVVAVPYHTAAIGIERLYRFLDPTTADPAQVMREAGADFFVGCALDAGVSRRFADALPLAVALGSGKPPPWLSECRPGEYGRLRVYRLGGLPEAQCPAPRR